MSHTVSLTATVWSLTAIPRHGTLEQEKKKNWGSLQTHNSYSSSCWFTFYWCLNSTPRFTSVQESGKFYLKPRATSVTENKFTRETRKCIKTEGVEKWDWVKVSNNYKFCLWKDILKITCMYSKEQPLTQTPQNS